MIHYTILQKPVEVSFTCEMCYEEYIIDFDEFVDEYCYGIYSDAFYGNTTEFECEACGHISRFSDDVEVD